MPIVNRQPESLLALPSGVLPSPQQEPEGPSTGSIFGAAFERNNLFGSALVHDYNFSRADNDFDPYYNAWDEIKGTHYEDKWEVFAQSNNSRYTSALKSQVDTEDRNNKTLAAGGGTALVANLSAGLLDPTIFIPVGGQIAKVRTGYTLLKAGLRTGVAGGAAIAIQETGLQATQETRPLEESVQNVAVGAILSGILGTGVTALLSKSETKLAEKGLNDFLTEVGKPTSAGAAATTKSLGLENLTIDPAGGAGKLAAMTQDLSPGLRLNLSPSAVSRQLGQELGESSVYQTGHAEGITTGPAVERFAENVHRARTAAMMRSMNTAYKDMGRAGTNMSWDDFAQAVGHALSNNDEGVNEFVSRAAKEARAATVDPLFREGKNVGLYDEADDVKFADSYFPRQYRKDEMIGRENEIKPQLYDAMEQHILRKYTKAAEAFRSKVDKIKTPPETRGKGEFFHGARGPISKLEEGYYNENNIYGGEGSFYTTDAHSIAKGYQRKHPTGVVYKVAENKPVKMFDMEQPLTEAQASEIFANDNLAALAFENHLSEKGTAPNLRELMNEMRASSSYEGLSKHDVQEIFSSAHYNLEKKGYGGMTHTGGLLTKNEPHTVKIYFDPAKQIKISLVEADEKIAEVTKATNKFLKTWEGKNLGSGVDPHDALNVPKFNNLSRLIVDDFYEKVTGRDYGSSSAISPEFLTPVERGPIKERTLPIHDNILSKMGILEKRADIVLRNYTRMLSGEIELARKYGKATLDDQLKDIQADYAKLREGVTDPKELKALNKRYNEDVRDISALRDLVRGTYRMEQNTSNYARVVTVANRFNFIRKMGRVVIRSLSDMMRPAMVHGLLPYMRDGVAPLIRNFEALNLSKEEARLAGIMTDVDLQYRAMALSSLADPFERGTAFERFMESSSRLATKWTLLPKWNDFWKGFEARITQNEILSGKMNTRTQAMLGIDPATKEKIDAQFAEFGEVRDGVYIAHTNDWTDENAVRVFRAAVGKNADATIVTPGFADQPLLMHRPTGRLFLQFKSYEFAAHSKVMLRGLQENKAKFVAGMISMTTIGMLSSMLTAWAAGKTAWERYKKSAQNPGFVVGEGLDNSGIFAIPFDAANTTERASNSLHYHFNPIKTPIMAAGSWAYPEASEQGKNLRYRDENISDIIGGPTAGTLQDVLVAGSGGVDKVKKGEITRKQQRAMIRLLPFNNFYGMNEGIQAVTGDSPYGDFDSVRVADVKKRY